MERSLDLGNVGPLTLLSGYQTPAALRRTGRRRSETWLRNRKVSSPEALAEAAVEAAERQHTAVPGEKITAQVIRTLAKEVMGLNEQIAEIDKLIAARFREHELAEVISSMPGIGPLLGAEFLAATAGDMSRYGSSDRLAKPCRSRPGALGLRQRQRQPAPPPALPPRPATRLLYLRADQRPHLRRVPPLLRTQARRGQAAHPGRARAGPATGQRSVGSDP